MMNQSEIDAADALRSRELSAAIAVERQCRRCRKVDPPTKERIEEVSNAVLWRRSEAIRDELARRLKAKGGSGAGWAQGE